MSTVTPPALDRKAAADAALAALRAALAGARLLASVGGAQPPADGGFSAYLDLVEDFLQEAPACRTRREISGGKMCLTVARHHIDWDACTPDEMVERFDACQQLRDRVLACGDALDLPFG